MINFTTGPVDILPSIKEALTAKPISHRSPEFAEMHSTVRATICQQLNVAESFIVVGSGTLANEMMIAQIALRKEKGLIVSNGEFGERLTDQAKRQQLNFETLRAQWGATIDMSRLTTLIERDEIKWILFCHCESSTGVVNPLAEITALCKLFSCDVYVDCMSTFGTIKTDLTDVSMATGSSGKGIGSIAGLAIIFCNQLVRTSASMPIYLDLLHVQKTNGIPFTISSNLLAGLCEAVKQNLNEARWLNLSALSARVYEKIHPLQLIPFGTPQNRIFTLAPQMANAKELGKTLYKKGIQLSYESEYLVKRNWAQLAIFGTYDDDDITSMLSLFDHW